jgi:hypothetical protein
MSTLACSADPAAWGAANRVELYPDRRQTWILATVLDRGQPDDLELKRMARAVIGRWLSDSPITDLGGRSGAADEITVGAPTTTQPELKTTVQRWTQLPGPLPLLRAGRLVYVPVSFSWRARETSRPWPTRRVSAWGFGGPCQVDADWILISVGEVDQAGPELSPTDRAVEAVGAALTPSPWLGAGLMLFGVGYLITAFRSR